MVDDGWLTVVVNEDLVKYMDKVGGNSSFLVSDPAWAEDFAPNGEFIGSQLVVTFGKTDLHRNTCQARGSDYKEALRKVGHPPSSVSNHANQP